MKQTKFVVKKIFSFVSDPKMEVHSAWVNVFDIKFAIRIHAQRMSQVSERNNAQSSTMKRIAIRNTSGSPILIVVS